MQEIKINNLTKKKSWMNPYVSEMMSTSPSATHASLIYGYSGSGKTFFLKWLAEMGVITKSAKSFFINVWEGAALEDLLSFMFPYGYNPNPDGKPLLTNGQVKQFIHTNSKPRAFDVAIYIPVSEKIPDLQDGYPENPFESEQRSGIIPFTIPLDQLAADEHVFQILHGSVDYGGAYRELQKSLREFMTKNQNVSLADLKKIVLGEKRNKLSVKKGYRNVDILHYSSATNEQTIAALSTRLSMLEYEGIVSSRGNPYALPKLMKKELKVPDRIVILYLGFVENIQLRFLIQAYFMKTIYKSMGAIRQHVPYKAQIIIDEAQDLFQSQKTKSTGDLGKCMLNLIMFLSARGRKYKCVPILGTQSQIYLDSESKANFKYKFCFKFAGEADIQWLSKEIGFATERLRDVFSDWEKRHLFRFLMIGGGFSAILHQQWGSVSREYGLELPRPILSWDKPVDLHLRDDKPRNWNMLGLSHSNHMQRALQLLENEWRDRESVQIEKWKRQKEEAKTKIQKEIEMTKKQTIIAMIRTMDKITRNNICDVAGVASTTLDKYIRDLLIEGRLLQTDIDKLNQNAMQSRVSRLMSQRLNRPFPDSLKAMAHFKRDDIETAMEEQELTESQISLQIDRWMEEGSIERLSTGKYRYIQQASNTNETRIESFKSQLEEDPVGANGAKDPDKIND